MRSRKVALSLGAAACGLCAFVLAHVALEHLARFAELELGAYPWHGEEHQILFSPASWVERGDGRIQLCGPSEAREAFRTDVLAQELPHLEPLSTAQSWGTLADLLAMLEYVERSYGASAMPDHLVVGINVRWIANVGLDLSPTLRAIDRYGPELRVERGSDPIELAERGFLEGVRARARHRLHQGFRYGNALRAVARRALSAVDPRLAASISRERLEPYRFARKQPRSAAFVRRFAEQPLPLWVEVQRWDAREHEARVTRDFARLWALCAAHDTALYVVNLPLRPAVLDFYDAELHGAYMDLVRRVLGGVPFLDLSDLLDDDEFFDSVHVTHAGAERVSLAVARLVAGETDVTDEAGEPDDAHFVEFLDRPEVGQ